MLVREILSDKGGTVYSCNPNDSLADVVELLVGYNCGSLVVSENGEMVGIITERDILRTCALTRQSLEVLSVRDRMTRCPVRTTPVVSILSAAHADRPSPGQMPMRPSALTSSRRNRSAAGC